MSSNGIKNKLSILVVDDQPEMRKSIVRILKLAGHKTAEASDGKKALEMALQEEWDLIISDLRMPEMDGVEFLHHLKRKKKIPFILMTGFSHSVETTEAYAIGADGFLQKPFKHNELLDCISETLNTKQSVESVGSIIESTKNIADNFCGISVDEFVSGREIKFPIFLKLSETKFVKIALCGEDLSFQKIEELKNKNVSFFYLLREDFKSYVEYAAKITESILASKLVSSEKKVKILRHSSELILSFGFQNHVDKKTFDLARHSVEQSLSLLSDSEGVFHLLEDLISQAEPIYAHSMGVAFISCLVAKSLGWASSPLFFRVVSGSIFHDLGKKSFSKEMLGGAFEKFTDLEKEIYYKHPSVGAELLSKIEDLPAEIAQIVLHHHELCDGSGFPDGISSHKIHPVAKVIGVSDEFFKLYYGVASGGQRMDPESAIKSIEFRNGEESFGRVKWEMLPALKKAFSLD